MLPYHKILVSGARGRLGSVICTRLSADYQIIEHVRGLDLSTVIALHQPDLIIDVTSHINILAHIAIYQRHAIPVIIGTSGISPVDARLVCEATPFPLLIVPNFSMGFKTLIQQAVILSSQYKVSKIIETHHNQKKDSPSGSSLFLADRLDTTIESIRVPRYIAKHEIQFCMEGSLITISHEVTDKSSFIPGILHAIEYISSKPSAQIYYPGS